MTRRLIVDRRGTAAAEFAIIVPLLMAIILILIQVSAFFWANAGLMHGVGQGARFAATWPRKTETEIVDNIGANVFGMGDAVPTSVLTYGKTGSVDYVDIDVSYQTSLLVLDVPAITLNDHQRVYLP